MYKSSNRTIAKNTAFLYFRMMIVMAVYIYTSRVILKSLGASDYGIYNVVGGVVAMMSFLNGALSASTSRFLTYELGTGNTEKLKRIFSACLNLHICVALLAAILAETIGLWFFYEKMVIPADRIDAAFWVYQFSIVTMFFAFTQVPYNASLISHEQMSVYAYVGLYEAFATLAIAYAVAFSPIDSLVFYAALLMLNKILVQLFYRLYTKWHYIECRLRLIRDRVLYKSLLSYSGWDLFGGVAGICQGQGLNLLLNLFFGPVINASRAIAYQVQGATGQFVGNFLVAVRPQVIKSFAEGNYDRMYSLTFQSAKYSFLMMLALVVPLGFEIDLILKIWLGDVPPMTTIFTLLVLVNALFETFHSAMLMSFHAIGKIRLGNMIGGTGMIMTLPLAYMALKFGAPAWSAFLVILIVNFILQLFNFWLLNHYIKYDIHSFLLRSVLPCVIIGISVFIAAWGITIYMAEGWFRFFTLGLVSELLLAYLTYYVALSTNEKNKVRKIFIDKYDSFKNKKR